METTRRKSGFALKAFTLTLFSQGSVFLYSKFPIDPKVDSTQRQSKKPIKYDCNNLHIY